MWYYLNCNNFTVLEVSLKKEIYLCINNFRYSIAFNWRGEAREQLMASLRHVSLNEAILPKNTSASRIILLKFGGDCFHINGHGSLFGCTGLWELHDSQARSRGITSAAVPPTRDVYATF